MKKILLFILLLVFVRLTVFSQFTNEFKTYNTTNTAVFSGNNFKSIWVGKGNQIWAGTQYQGLYKFDTVTKAWSKSSQLTNVFINDIKADKNGGIWVAQSGTSGQSGGASNIAGGVNYFPDGGDGTMVYYSNAIISGGFVSRNTRSIFIDTLRPNAAASLPRVWGVFATFISSSNTVAGGISYGLNSNPSYFTRKYEGLQVYPNTNFVSKGTPSCYTVGGDKNEIWVGTEQNYVAGPTSQILRYDAATGKFLGGYDNLGAFDKTRGYYFDQKRNYTDTVGPKGILATNFRSTAIHFDAENRQWIGFRSGGIVVKQGSLWKVVNMPTFFPPGTIINFNAITSDEYGYVYIGTNNGLVVYDGGGAVDNPVNYKRYTTTEGLASNNISGICYDKAGGRVLLASDAGVTFWKVKYKIDVSMQWDYSFPFREGQPVGVAADGVSRVYLKVKKASDTLPEIKSVNIKVFNWNVLEQSSFGKLKKATVIDRYSDEANNGTGSEVTISDADVKPGGPGTFWFWYISPEDFSASPLGPFANLTERYDSVRVIATYVNDKKDTVNYKIRVVRPPLILQHGFNGYAYGWDKFAYDGIHFKDSYHFKYVNRTSVDPKGSSKKAAEELLGGDNKNGGFGLNSLQGNIGELRKMRFASNQVDFICHSMGGVYIRSAATLFTDKFKANGNYLFNNYGKGFTHKVVAVNVPHNGSPFADLPGELLAIGPDILHGTLFNIYNFISSLTDVGPLMGNLIEPVEPNNTFFSRMKLTDATRDLQVTDKNGGLNLAETNFKNHIIAGDVDGNLAILPLGFKASTINFEKVDKALNSMYGVLLEMQYAALRDPEANVPPEFLQDFKTKVLDQPHDVRIFTFLSWFFKKKGYPRHLEDGDVIVPLTSQLAKQQDNLPSIKIFKNTSPDLVNAEHSSIIRVRNDVGLYVFDLLNSQLSSNLWANTLPANTDPDPGNVLLPIPRQNLSGLKKQTALSAVTSYDTTKIKIDFPLAGAALKSDSLLTILYRVKDTLNLAYVTIRFQWADSLRTKKSLTQQSLNVQIDSSLTGNQKVFATAVYDRPGGGVDYFVDSFTVKVNYNGTLQDVKFAEDPIEVLGETIYYPKYLVKYDNRWLSLPANNPDIVMSIDSPSIATYNNATKTITGVNNGSTLANVSYLGFVDTVVIRVTMPSTFGCINQTIASGSFKNPAIWSSGSVPDLCDSVIINTGHSVTIDTSLQNRSLLIKSGATLTLNNAAITYQLGKIDDGSVWFDNYGTLNINNGRLQARGRIKQFAASSFNMTGGTLLLDGNTGFKETSLGENTAVFEATVGMASFAFTGGTLQITDPPNGTVSQTINCPYDFGNNSTLILGDGSSTTASKNLDGFGGLSFPNKIGKLIINASTKNGNRQLVIKKALNVKGSVEVKTGSGIIIQAPITVNK